MSLVFHQKDISCYNGVQREENVEFHCNGIEEKLAFLLCHYNYSSWDETWNCKFSWIYRSFNFSKWNKIHCLGQNPQAAAVGSKRATRTEENRFTALLSRMGFPAMYFTSLAGLLTTMPVLSSKPAMKKKQVRWKIQMTWKKKISFLLQRR